MGKILEFNKVLFKSELKKAKLSNKEMEQIKAYQSFYEDLFLERQKQDDILKKIFIRGVEVGLSIAILAFALFINIFKH